jgi:hypothetical protein
MAIGETYEEFVEKFKPKKTTDDCYTPAPVYDCVADWVAEKYELDKETFVRPFYPGGDYENYDYPDGGVVVDNPPFSILSKIVQFYAWKEIKYFLFAPALTCGGVLRNNRVYDDACAILTASDITYANGAVVQTSFITNLEKEYCMKTEPELTKRLKDVCDALRREQRRELPKYIYPYYVVSTALAQRYAKYGVEYAIRKEDAIFISGLDAQREYKKEIFGHGLLLSERAAAERAAAESAAAERAAAERAAAHVWELSEREQRLVEMLTKHGRR